MKVLVFKTDLLDRGRIQSAAPCLETLDGILKWNVDLHDRDFVLRIESEQLSPRNIEDRLQQAGYYCEELPD